ncbi:MAG: hypothetical protein CMK32_07745 [Porticoccaceae bacterium]|nr:hypothetical protein [Porticoccaceae bacterium]
MSVKCHSLTPLTEQTALNYLAPKDVADRLGISQRSANALLRSGELETINVSVNPNSKKQRLRVTPEALEAFMRSRSVKPTNRKLDK